ncbi:MAG: c-type cytochrome [Bacteroidota bacterium]|nr:c-type cytochrome [Bacteroidota bacterium]
MKSVLFTSAQIPALLQIILLFGILPPVNVGVEERVISVVEGEFFEIRNLNAAVVADKENVLEQQPSPEKGMELFAKKGCVACHDTDVETKDKLGPRMKGLFGSVRHFEDGKSTVANEDYIRQSILAPTEKVVKGYQGVMPPYGSILTPDEVASVILYIKSL